MRKRSIASDAGADAWRGVRDEERVMKAPGDFEAKAGGFRGERIEAISRRWPRGDLEAKREDPWRSEERRASQNQICHNRHARGSCYKFRKGEAFRKCASYAETATMRALRPTQPPIFQQFQDTPRSVALIFLNQRSSFDNISLNGSSAHHPCRVVCNKKEWTHNCFLL